MKSSIKEAQAAKIRNLIPAQEAVVADQTPRSTLVQAPPDQEAQAECQQVIANKMNRDRRICKARANPHNQADFKAVALQVLAKVLLSMDRALLVLVKVLLNMDRVLLAQTKALPSLDKVHLSQVKVLLSLAQDLLAGVIIRVNHLLANLEEIGHLHRRVVLLKVLSP